MADDFQGTGKINLQPGSSNVPYRFRVTVATSSQKNDGMLPYGSTMMSYTVREKQMGTTVSSSKMVVTKSLDGNEMVLRMTWTTQINPGHYGLEFNILATVSGSTLNPLKKQLDFNRVYLKRR